MAETVVTWRFLNIQEPDTRDLSLLTAGQMMEEVGRRITKVPANG